MQFYRIFLILSLLCVFLGIAFAEEPRYIGAPMPSIATTTTISASTTITTLTTSIADDSTKKGVITLRWRTESEQDNYGFNVYRGESETGSFEKINPAIVRGNGTTSEPHDYTYVDHEVYKGKKYYYYLMDVDLAGNTKKFTPTISRYLPTDEEMKAEKEKKETAQPKPKPKVQKSVFGGKEKRILLFLWVVSGLTIFLFG